nr:DUF5680 domain-containing protein [Desulfosporosinus acidiphilus]
MGGRNFAGEETLWENNQPFWSMNYIGRILPMELTAIF